MKKIKLTQGKYAIIDDKDFEFINRYQWHYDGRYAARAGKHKVYMHMEINKTLKGFDTDHINRNKLDNCRCNLRSVTRSQNFINIGLKTNNTSGYKGVSWYRRYKKWKVSLNINKKYIWIGYFVNKEDAIKARRKAELIYHII